MILCANPLAQYQSHREEILDAVRRVLESGQYILGPEVAAFENAFAQYCGVRNGVGVNSGTDALILALRAMDIGAGDEVITVSHTALATVSAILATGATPVLVDIEPEYYTIDPVAIEKAVTKRTKVVIPVHIYGQAADMDAVMLVADKYNLKVIEDCSQATGTRFHGKRVGSIGDAGCFSFYPTKNLGGIGDGGMVVSNNASLSERIRRLRQYGWNERRSTEEPGLNSRLDELQAAILGVKLQCVDEDNERRREIARIYCDLLRGSGLVLPMERPDSTHIFHLFVVACDDREVVQQKLAASDIHAGIHYRVPAHLHAGYDRLCRLPDGGLPQTELLAKQILSLPIYPELTPQEAGRVASIVNS
jgi:dTDP-4-amino-4,6-dideoxygalactose transaminase